MSERRTPEGRGGVAYERQQPGYGCEGGVFLPLLRMCG